MHEETPHKGAGHETTDASVRPIVVTAAVLAIGAAAVCLLVYGIFVFLEGHRPATALVNPMSATGPQFPPTPRLAEHPAAQLQDLRASEDAILSSYGWSDKKAGTVRIPIDRAMELML